MKNPFEKNDHKVLIAGIVIGTVIAGAAAYLFLTETGTEVRGQLAGHFGRMREAFLGGGKPEEAAQQEQPEYLQQPHKKPKTDRERLLKHEIIPGAGHTGGENQPQADQHE